MNDNILVPVDGSEHSAKAVHFAADVAERYGSELLLLHVVQTHEVPDGLRRWAALENVHEPPEWLMGTALAERVLEDAEGRAKKHGVKSVERLMENGNPARQILEVVAARKIDLVVMGTRGHSDLEGLVMGSVAHKVTHGAACTVVTVK